MKISAYIVLVFLTCLILFNSIKASLTYAYFELDPIGFIENLCENKDKPELQCNGKCHLKKVAESQDKKQTTPERIIDFKELILYPNPIEEFELPIRIYSEKQQYITYQNLYFRYNLNVCFHPPRV
jgi:hypothetical protein